MHPDGKGKVPMKNQGFVGVSLRMNRLASGPASATLKEVRRRLPVLIPTLVLCMSSVASAGVFGGFAKDGSFRKGADQVCSPAGVDKPCATKSVAELARVTYAKGTKQVGSGATIKASKRGSEIQVLLIEDGKQLASWDTSQVVSALGDVYLDPSSHWAAVEYQTRFAGRVREEVVVLPVSVPRAPAEELVPSAQGASENPAVAKSSENPDFEKAIVQGVRFSKKRRTHAKAQVEFEKALALIPEHPEALFHLAVLHSKRGNAEAAIATLRKLAASSHPHKPRWRVEARYELQFKALRGNTDFRNAVGITRSAGEQPSLYERLVALGGRWEQEGIPCEEPEVSLTLRRDQKQRFDLVIRSKCQGMAETTRLDGTWEPNGKAGLAMSFPNMDSDDDKLTCKVEACTDDSGEDCLRCHPEPDLEFLLRVVRR